MVSSIKALTTSITVIARKTHDGINNAAEDGTLTTEKPCHQIKLKQADEAPVQTADDGQNLCQCIHKLPSVLLLDGSIMPESKEFMHPLPFED